MKYIWGFIILISVVYGIYSNNYINMYDELVNNVSKSLKQTFNLMSIIILWNPLFKILEESKLINVLLKPFKKIISIVIKDEEEVLNNFSLSLLVSSFGLSQASLSYTFKALDKCKDVNKEKITLLNIFPITLFPNTILQLRRNYKGAVNFWLYIVIISIIMFIISIVYIKNRYQNE